MKHHQNQAAALGYTSRVRLAVIGGLLCLIIAAHWFTPTTSHDWHAVHLFLRMFFFVPVVLAAIWFDLRGALIAAGATTLLYLPHVILQWAGRPGENMNQIAELVSIWLCAVLAGVLSDKEKGALRQISATHEGALIALVGALDAREHDTELHSLRVREYALRLGRGIGMRGHELKVLGQAALLHDVGKIGVPDGVLLKPGSLTEGEWELMRAHVATGRQILEPVSFLREASEIVYCHHEKFDGSGYPRGLNGDAIPLGARVFAIVDAYDAIVSKRPYKDAVAPLEAREQIVAGTGRSFDPRIMDTFVAIPHEEWEKIGKSVSSHYLSTDKGHRDSMQQ